MDLFKSVLVGVKDQNFSGDIGVSNAYAIISLTNFFRNFCGAKLDGGTIIKYKF